MGQKNISKFMQEAVELADQSIPFAYPNPAVGAIITKNNKIIGKGHTAHFGGSHAEVKAINSVKQKKLLTGSTLYTTLEPCCHVGKTPPCTDAIIKSGIKKVFVGIVDPDRQVAGAGIKALQRAGILVKTGDGVELIQSQLLPYLYSRTNQLPFMTVKLAASIDGKIATSSGNSQWISGKQSRLIVHQMRKKVDAVLVGSQTVIKDNPNLTARYGKKLYKNQPTRIAIDSNGIIPIGSNIFNKDAKTLIMTTTSSSTKWRTAIKKKGHDYIIIPKKSNKVDLYKCAQALHDLGMIHVLVEGGGKLIGALIKRELITKMNVFYAPKIIGNKNAINMIDGLKLNYANQALQLSELSYQLVGKDISITATIKYH
jgi:diaminohydroxyphosphoribosylaminopyrimidine deaminase/5-amino-6-(5-phosphoribosylamino)uracil reductase